MTPTIGRIVHYAPSEDEAKRRGPDPVPAIVAAVWSSECVNLQVFWSNAPVEVVASVVFSEGGGAPRSWYWPPRA